MRAWNNKGGAQREGGRGTLGREGGRGHHAKLTIHQVLADMS